MEGRLALLASTAVDPTEWTGRAVVTHHMSVAYEVWQRLNAFSDGVRELPAAVTAEPRRAARASMQNAAMFLPIIEAKYGAAR